MSIIITNHQNVGNQSILNQRILSFDYLNQQLVFQELSDFFEVLAPFAVGASRVVSQMVTAAKADAGLAATLKKMQSTSARGTNSKERSNSSSVMDSHVLKDLISNIDVDSVVCCRCESVGSHSPYMVLPCQHHYCYYCIAQHIVNNNTSNAYGKRDLNNALETDPNDTIIASGMCSIRCTLCLTKIHSIVPIRKKIVDK